MIRNLGIDYENPPDLVKAFALELATWLHQMQENTPKQRWTYEAIKAKTWRAQLTINRVVVCAAAHWALQQGIPIASSNRGYWWAETPEELGITVDYLMSKVTREHAKISYVKKIQDQMREAALKKKQLHLGFLPDKDGKPVDVQTKDEI